MTRHHDYPHRDMKNLGQQSRRAYIRDLKEVIEQADVILEVRRTKS